MKAKKTILATIKDLCTSFTYYDRREDEGLTVDQLKNAVELGEITIDEMVAEFKSGLEKAFEKQT